MADFGRTRLSPVPFFSSRSGQVLCFRFRLPRVSWPERPEIGGGPQRLRRRSETQGKRPLHSRLHGLPHGHQGLPSSRAHHEGELRDVSCRRNVRHGEERAFHPGNRNRRVHHVSRRRSLREACGCAHSPVAQPVPRRARNSGAEPAGVDGESRARLDCHVRPLPREHHFGSPLQSSGRSRADVRRQLSRPRRSRGLANRGELRVLPRRAQHLSYQRSAFDRKSGQPRAYVRRLPSGRRKDLRHRPRARSAQIARGEPRGADHPPFYLVMIPLAIGFMFFHQLIDFLRKLSRRAMRVISPEETEYRSNRHFRIAHWLVLISFPVLALTGFALKFPEAWWARPFISWNGHFDLRGSIHRAAAVVLMAALGYHAVHLFVDKRARHILSGMAPGIRDIHDLQDMVSYNLGFSAARPALGEFNYVQKIEYLAFLWGSLSWR